MKSSKNMIKSDSQYTRIYENMRGMDTADLSENATESYAYTENMYFNRKTGGGCLESIPGFRLIAELNAPINGIFKQRLGAGQDYLIVHAGNALYRFNVKEIDTLPTLTPIALLSDQKSAAYTHGRKTYILDGESIITVDENGETGIVTEGTDHSPYIPITYKNGEAFEERNLLTDKFKEIHNISAYYEVSYGTPGLIYEITDAESMTCSVVGASDLVMGTVHIPSYALIGGKRYLVTEISQNAFFGNKRILELVCNPGLKSVGRYSCWMATNLRRVILSSTVETVGEYAFYGCTALEYLFFGTGIRSIGAAAVSGCTALEKIHCAADEKAFGEVDGLTVLTGLTGVYNAVENSVSIGIPVKTPAAQIGSVRINDTEVNFAFDKVNGIIRMILDHRSQIEGRTVTVYGRVDNSAVNSENSDGDYLSLSIGKRLLPNQCIVGCKATESFDGRIFLSANASLAGSVFYNTAPIGGEPHPLYFGSKSYLVDGVNDYNVTDIIATRGALAVFKSGDDPSGSIFYHTPTGDKNVPYHTSYVHSRIDVCGGAYNMNGETVFLTSDGICALGRTDNTGYREAEQLSRSISKLVTGSRLEGAALASWLGYLAVSKNGEIYLGDPSERSKSSAKEYEWYILRGIGTYKNSTRVCRYADIAAEGLSIHPMAGEKASGVLYSRSMSDGLHYYTRENGKEYEVYLTEEMEGGDFYPATILESVGEYLFFGNDYGDICVFNNDKIGVPPERIKSSEGFDEVEYAKVMKDTLHPDFYSFHDHAPTYRVSTAEDDCGIPYLTKDTVGGSLVIKCKNATRARLNVEINNDSEGVLLHENAYLGESDFSDVYFGGLSFGSSGFRSIPVDDRSKRWVSKRITVFSDGFRSPIGIASIAYRYKIKGKIKS